jgi:hypothetical protein
MNKSQFCKEHPYLCELENNYLNYFNGKVIPNQKVIPNVKVVPNVKVIPNNSKPPIPTGSTTGSKPKPNNSGSGSGSGSTTGSKPPVPTGSGSTGSKKQKNNSGLVPPIIPRIPRRPTISSLEDDDIIKAKMIQAANKYYSGSPEEAQSFLDSSKINYVIDEELSKPNGLVLINEQTGEIRIAYRGTDILNPSDFLTNISSLGGLERKSPEYLILKKQIKLVKSKYSMYPEELVGFSRGSLLSMNLGNEFNIPTTQFNPLLSGPLIKSQTLNSSAEHNIIATTGDVVSGTGIYNLPEGTKWNVRTIFPKQDTFDPIEEHSLHQFDTNEVPRRMSVPDLLALRAKTSGDTVAELTTVDAVKQSISQGKSFSDHIRDFSPADINESGDFSPRIHSNSNFTEIWKEQGGTFNPSELDQINNAIPGPKPDFTTSSSDRIVFGNKDQATRTKLIEQGISTTSNAIDTLNNYKQPVQTQNELMNQANPSNISKGVLSGVIASGELTGFQDISGVRLNQTETSVAGGGLAGIHAAQLSELKAGIGAGAAGSAFAAGAVGGLTALETQRQLYNSLKESGANENTAQSISSIGAGAAGGGSAAATTALIGASEAGGEAGLLLAPETAGLSIPIGIALGAVVGAASFGTSKLINWIKH